MDTSNYFYAPGYDRLTPSMGSNEQDHTVTGNNVFSSVDITAYLTLPTKQVFRLGNLALLSISTHRDKFPVTSLGRIKVRGFTAGSRVIAGTMVFSSFDRSVFHRMMTSIAQEQKDAQVKDPAKLKMRKMSTQLADELPPFDVNITFVNEFGAVSYTGITGVTILDQGATYSIDNINVMETYSYMATDIIPFQPYQVLTNIDTQQSLIYSISEAINNASF